MTNVELLRDVLAWCSVINLGLLLIWLLAFTNAHGWMYRLHCRWFNLKLETFDTLHYAGMAVFKMGILLFNLVPYIVLRLIV
jgi:hypothetical protein